MYVLFNIIHDNLGVLHCRKWKLSSISLQEYKLQNKTLKINPPPSANLFVVMPTHAVLLLHAPHLAPIAQSCCQYERIIAANAFSIRNSIIAWVNFLEQKHYLFHFGHICSWRSSKVEVEHFCLNKCKIVKLSLKKTKKLFQAV